MFKFSDSSRKFCMDYKATVNTTVYGGKTWIQNNNSSPEFYGEYVGWASSCPSKDFATLDAWFSNTSGQLATFPCFDRIPLTGLDTGAGYSLKAFVSGGGGLIIKTFKGIYETPYTVINAVPVSSSFALTTVPVNASPKFTAAVGTQVDVNFGFLIYPEKPSYVYEMQNGRVIFETIPFRVLPKV